MVRDIDAIVLFSGPGGSSLGLRMAGVNRTVGVEYEPTAVATAHAAGLNTVLADVRDLIPLKFRADHIDPFAALLLQSSPPCQGLSLAGKGTGREDVGLLLEALADVRTLGIDRRMAVRAWTTRLREECKDERSPLTFETIRWVADLMPEFVMLEQVPAALPIWQEFALVLEAWGYSVWAGCVQAEQYGVPQTRKRAVLMASRVSTVEAPVPTHSKYHNRSPQRLDEGVLPWVSMAQALGWGMDELIGFPRKYDGRGESIEFDGELYRGRDLRSADKPAFVVTEKARSWERYTHMGDVRNKNGCVRSVDQPAPTMTASMDNGNFRWVDRETVRTIVEPRVNNQSGTEFDLAWPADRPAPTIAGRDIVTMPGANANRFNGATKSRNDGIRVTVEEAGALQSFPFDYPWQGTKTLQHQQVGNAVPPLLQRALTSGLLAASDTWCSEENAA